MALERLQKILSAAGISSRREAERLIAEGRVELNGQTVTRLGTRADPATDRIKVNGRLVKVPEHKLYLALYKPKGVVSTLRDPEGRPTLLDLLPGLNTRVFHVGRLDFNTEGLLLLTNDGEFAERVAHPRHGCEKVYLAKVSGVPAPAALEKVRTGVYLDGTRTLPARVDLVRSTRRDGNSWLVLTLQEGRSREVRRLMAAVGHPVSKLKRVQVGAVSLGTMKPGEVRPLAPREVRGLLSGARPREEQRPKLPGFNPRRPRRVVPKARAGRPRRRPGR